MPATITDDMIAFAGEGEYETKDIRHTHAFISEEKDAIDDEDYSINFVVSTDVIDREGEIVQPEAVYEAIGRKGEFSENPAALPCHQHRLQSGMPPSVGHWEPSTARLYKKRCEMRLFFAKGTVLGDEYWLYYKGRHMRAVSIGFRIRESRVETINGQNVLVITKIELLEISCVAVGSNPYALSKLKWLHGSAEELDAAEKTKNILVQAIVGVWQQEMKELAERFNSLKNAMAKDFERIYQELDDIKSILISDSDGFADELLLGGDSDSPDPAGAKIAEHCQRIEKLLSEGD